VADNAFDDRALAGGHVYEERGVRRGVRLGVDVGSARIGVARCDPDGLLATPVETVAAVRPRRGPRTDLSRIAAIAAETGAVEVVVGLPRGLSGAEGTAAAKSRQYAVQLARLLHPVPVRLVDERLTTVTATRGLRESGVRARESRAVVDQAAAVIILQSALDAERVSGNPPGELVTTTRRGGAPEGGRG
jgi:putative Holliday junction resolvase